MALSGLRSALALQSTKWDVDAFSGLLDQVAGFGGSAKRSIGSKLMSSQLQEIFRRVQKKKP